MTERGKAPRPGFDKGAFYRLMRMLHTYVSAIAFASLLFFSVTGILLNHPEWFDNDTPRERTAETVLTPAEVVAARAANDPGRALAAAIARRVSLPGAYSSGEILDDQALIRLDGPKGTADVSVDLKTGRASIRIGEASFASLIIDLHRGKNSGEAWRIFIDLSAWLFLAVSIIGFVIVFSLRFRMTTSLAMAVGGTIAMVAIMTWLVT